MVIQFPVCFAVSKSTRGRAWVSRRDAGGVTITCERGPPVLRSFHDYTTLSESKTWAYAAVCVRRLRSGLPAAARHWRWPLDLLKHIRSHLDRHEAAAGPLPFACACDSCDMHSVVAWPGRHAGVADRYRLPSAWAGHAATAINTKHASSAFGVIAAIR